MKTFQITNLILQKSANLLKNSNKVGRFVQNIKHLFTIHSRKVKNTQKNSEWNF